MEYIDLFTLQNNIKELVSTNMPSGIWLVAEIRSLQTRSGHCYLELSQSDDNAQEIARLRAIIWRSRYQLISSYFRANTGSELSEGMQILVRVDVNYSELYGFSLIINEIKPEYSLGEQESKRTKNIELLNADGLMQRQKSLTLSLLPRTIALISSASAAGLRDFIQHINESVYSSSLQFELFEAVMQGKECPSSVVDAINRVEEATTKFDLIFILRGGGSKLDLAAFDDYEMCKRIAQSQIPVVTAVGHDQDYHICDMIAYDYCKTPTALADYVLSMYYAQEERLYQLQSRLHQACMAKIAVEEEKLNRLLSSVKFAFILKLNKEAEKLNMLQARLKNICLSRINLMLSKLDLYEHKIHSADPRQIIQRGYILALDASGKVLKSSKSLEKGDSVTLLFDKAKIDCIIQNIEENGQ